MDLIGYFDWYLIGFIDILYHNMIIPNGYRSKTITWYTCWLNYMSMTICLGFVVALFIIEPKFYCDLNNIERKRLAA